MSLRMQLALLGLAVAASLAACSTEPDQTQARQADNEAWEGAKDPFMTAGWQPGDKNSWEQHLRQRAVGQNEYVRIGS